MFLLHVRAEPFAQHCYPLDLGCTNDSVFNVSTDMAESFLICSFLLSSIAVFLWSCLHTSLSFDHRVSLTWFVVVSFPGSQLQVNSTYHLDFLGLLDGCLSLYHFSNVLQVFCTWCTYAKSHQDCHCLGKCKRTTRKPRSWFQSVWGGGRGCELRRCFCEPHHSCKLSYLQKEQSKCRGGFPGEGEMAVRINFQGDDDKRSGTAFGVILIRSQSCVLWYIYSIKFDSISTIKLRPLLLLKLKCGAQRRKNRS